MVAPRSRDRRRWWAALNFAGAVRESAVAAGMPAGLFGRLIWTESRFRADAVSPAGASGIAQFMPGTAEEQGLDDPFDPLQSIDRSARYLRELKDRFGNWGLAAAAYNGGPTRVRGWLEASRPLPRETREYVLAVTGRSVELFRTGKPSLKIEPASFKKEELEDCISRARRSVRGSAGAPEAAEEPRQPWGVEVARHFRPEIARKLFQQIARRYPALLADYHPTIVAERLRSHGNLTQQVAQVGVASRAKAESLCAQLQRAGGRCRVVRN